MSFKQRNQFIDGFRAIAVLAMIVYHFAWDLGFFNIVDPIIVNSGIWKLFAISIGCSFLFLSGISFWFSSVDGINIKKFFYRLAVLIGAALLVSIGTYQADPNTFVFFGILHLLATCTLVGLLTHRLPSVILILIGISIAIGQPYLMSEYFQPKYLAWTGLFPGPTGSVDFYGFFPWSAAYIFGLALAKMVFISKQEPIWPSGSLFIRSSRRSAISSIFFWMGRNSLLIYLLHQPVLMAIIFGYLNYL